MKKIAQRIIVPQSTIYNRQITGKIYAVSIQGPIGAGFTIGTLQHQIGISGIYEIAEQPYPLGEITIDPIAQGYIIINYYYEEEEK